VSSGLSEKQLVKQSIMKKIEKWQLIVLTASLIQLIAPVMLMLAGHTPGFHGTETKILPAGYTFTIWYAIIILSFAYGVFQVFPNSANKHLHFIMSTGLTVVYVSFVLWLILMSANWVILSVLLFLVMFGVLTLLLERVIREKQILSFTERVLLFGQIAIYTGWVTVAIFFNAASAIKYYGLSDTGISGIVWQSLILILVLINNEYWLRKFHGTAVYACTLLWALTGVLFRLVIQGNSLSLVIITVAAIVLIITELAFKNAVIKVFSKKSREDSTI
jgi:hypothetical protein